MGDLVEEEREIFGIIYLATNVLRPVKQKQYVGETTQTLSRRWYYHKQSAIDGANFLLHQAIRDYGSEAFTVEQIDLAYCLDELNKKETYWIKELKTIAPFGYNMTYGGDGNAVSEETRRRQSLAHLGHKASWETRDKMSASRLGHPVSEETRRKQSESNRGKQRSAEFCKYMSDIQRGHLRKTHCKFGHLYDSVTTYWRPNGSRVCRICYYLRKHSPVPDLFSRYLTKSDKS
jgi:group I intron endonuclease